MTHTLLASVLFFVTTIATLASTANAHTAIITDVDDTIKITHVNCLPDAIIRGPYTATAFLGMNELYNGLAGENADAPVYYVSGAPSFLINSVQWFLGRNDFPYGEILLRDFFARPGTVAHKTSKINEILQNNKDQFLLIGDDTESDFDIYHEIRTQHPERIIEAYIHLVRNDQKLPANATGYFNAADLAIRETLAGRISENKTKGIFEKFISAEIDDEAILPEFAACPEKGWLTKLANSNPKLSSELQSLAIQVEAKVNAKCIWNKEQIEKRERERNASY